MHLIQLFLPLYDEKGSAFPDKHYTAVRYLLTEKFGGVTAYARAPAKGFWKDAGKVQTDDIVVFEVMAEELDRTWWETYRNTLETRFRQDELLIRAHSVDVL